MKANLDTFQIDPDTMLPRPPSFAVFFGGSKNNTVEAMEFKSGGTLWECPEEYFYKGGTSMSVALASHNVYSVKLRLYVTKEYFNQSFTSEDIAKTGFQEAVEWLESVEEFLKNATHD